MEAAQKLEREINNETYRLQIARRNLDAIKKELKYGQ